jgi:hypothetical protein
MANKSKYRVSRFAKEEKFGLIFNYLMDAGFTEPEALWGANEPVDLNSQQVQDLVEHRRDLVEMFMGDGFTREQSIKLASEDLQSKLDRRNIRELNIYYEISP